MAATVALLSCSRSGESVNSLTPVVAAIVSGHDAPSTDVFEVWLCDVPVGTTDLVFAAGDERLRLEAGDLAARVAEVSDYFAGISHGQYRPSFVGGGRVRITADETSEQCIERAIGSSSPDADAVLVVATAEHAADQPGGRATPGSWIDCTNRCSASTTGRYVYLGANDFHPDLDDAMPLDLIEHEIGHSLGLPHSGSAIGDTTSKGLGPYDLMGDPASPRSVDPARRDGPDMLAVNRLALGWLAVDTVVIEDLDSLSDPSRRTEPVELRPSTSSDGNRLLVLPIDEHTVLSVELLPDVGFDDHLPASGVVVHLIDDSPARCGAISRCTTLQRSQQIVSIGQSQRTLLRAGDGLTYGPWRVQIEAIADDVATVTIGPS